MESNNIDTITLGIVFLIGIIAGAGATGWLASLLQVRADIRRYDAQWTAKDREASAIENATQVARAAQFKRQWKQAEHTAKVQAVELMTRERDSAIPIGEAYDRPRRLVMPDRPYAPTYWQYGAGRAA
jgi:hypothetical protein